MTARLDVLSVVTPYPPSVNHLYIRTRRGVIRADKAVKFEEDVRSIVKDTLALYAEYLGEDAIPPAHPWSVDVLLCLPDRRRRDLDNTAKAILDSVTRALGVDDANVCDLRLHRRLARKNPRAEIVIRHAEEEPEEDG